jgi:hypothetical protein
VPANVYVHRPNYFKDYESAYTKINAMNTVLENIAYQPTTDKETWDDHWNAPMDPRLMAESVLLRERDIMDSPGSDSFATYNIYKAWDSSRRYLPLNHRDGECMSSFVNNMFPVITHGELLPLYTLFHDYRSISPDFTWFVNMVSNHSDGDKVSIHTLMRKEKSSIRERRDEHALKAFMMVNDILISLFDEERTDEEAEDGGKGDIYEDATGSINMDTLAYIIDMFRQGYPDDAVAVSSRLWEE